MRTNQPRLNQADFVAVQHNKVVAIVPDGHLDESTTALAQVGVDLGQVDVLQGEIGACILDFDGTEHGPWAHLVRTVQKLGTASNERENYAAALRGGEAVIIVPVHQGIEVDACSRVLAEHGCRRIIHFGKYAVEQMSY
jgi:hypothetical protein